MKIIVSALLTLTLVSCSTTKKESSKTPQPLWVTSAELDRPESSYYHSKTQQIFVSNVAGSPTEKDGNGWISIYDLNGNLVKAKWVSGLNAPKGLRAHGNHLWTTDIDTIIKIDLNTGRILKKIAVKGAKFLNDVAIDASGNVYVSDMLDNKIYKVSSDRATVFKKGVETSAPNGLYVMNYDLLVAAWGLPTDGFKTKVPGKLYKISLTTKVITEITTAPLGNLDGLELDNLGHFIVSDWMAGKVFYVTADGKSTEILSGIAGSADIGYVPEKNMLIVPSMQESKLYAFDLSLLTGYD